MTKNFVILPLMNSVFPLAYFLFLGKDFRISREKHLSTSFHRHHFWSGKFCKIVAVIPAISILNTPTTIKIDYWSNKNYHSDSSRFFSFYDLLFLEDWIWIVLWAIWFRVVFWVSKEYISKIIAKIKHTNSFLFISAFYKNDCLMLCWVVLYFKFAFTIEFSIRKVNPIWK